MDCHHRTFLLFMFIMLFAAGYILVNQWPMHQKVSNNNHRLHRSQIAAKLLPDLQRLDRFIDIQLQELNATGAPTNVIPNSGNLSRYVNTMTPDTQTSLSDILTTLNTRYNTELDRAQTRAIDTKDAIDNLFVEMNNTLLKELQLSYKQAHVINNKRKQTMKTIDDLPLKIMA